MSSSIWNVISELPNSIVFVYGSVVAFQTASYAYSSLRRATLRNAMKRYFLVHPSGDNEQELELRVAHIFGRYINDRSAALATLRKEVGLSRLSDYEKFRCRVLDLYADEVVAAAKQFDHEKFGDHLPNWILESALKRSSNEYFSDFESDLKRLTKLNAA